MYNLINLVKFINCFCIIGAVIEVTVDGDNVLSGIHFQDTYIVGNYKRFPDMLFMAKQFN